MFQWLRTVPPVAGSVIAVSATVGTLWGGYLAVTSAWATFDLPTVPSRQYVDHRFGKIELAQNQTATNTDRLLKFQIEQQIRQVQQDRSSKGDSESLKQYQADLEQQAREAKERIEQATTRRQ